MAENKKQKDVFEFEGYKEFMASRVGPRNGRQGIRGAIARALNCQPTYISQILYAKAHLSLEQAEKLTKFFGFTADESHFFLLLVQRERAGTKELSSYFGTQIERIRDKRLILTKRLGKQSALSSEDQSLYYSSWQFAAIHMATTIPRLQSIPALSSELQIPVPRVALICEKLAFMNLVEKKGEQVRALNSQIRIGNDSHNIIRHHANWRQRAIESLERESLTDLHYSAAVTLAKADVAKLKSRMLEFIGEFVAEIRESKEEQLCAIALDFFRVGVPD